MKISDQGLNLLKIREGVRSAAYRDSAGHLTIGVGHLLTKSELSSGKIRLASGEVNWRDGLTDSQIDELLRQDLERFEAAVHRIAKRRMEEGNGMLRDHQRDALISFAFNVGVRAFETKSLARYVVEDQRELIPDKWREWVYAGGQVIDGLKKRRESEIAQWLAPYEEYQPLQPSMVEFDSQAFNWRITKLEASWQVLQEITPGNLTRVSIALEAAGKRLDNLEAGLDLLEQQLNRLADRGGSLEDGRS